MNDRWRWRGSVALLGVSLAFFILPVLPVYDVINSDWPAFATGARLIVNDPAHLYDLNAQQRVEKAVTGGRILVSPGIQGILPFLAPAWVALLAVPFDQLDPNLGGRLWVLFGLACLLGGLYLATRPRPPTAVLPAFASVPTALMMLNAQLDGFVALGIGGAIALWPQRYLAGIVLGLTLVKPQLVLPLGVAVIVAREWKVLAGWAAGGLVLLLPTLVLNPHWIADWLAQTRATVAPVSREVDLPHFGVLLPGSTVAVAVLTLATIAAVVYLAWRARGSEMRPPVAVLVIGGVLASPHALPADLVLVAVGLAMWGQARWFDWLALSAGALVCALTPPPLPAIAGLLLIAGLLARISLSRSRAPVLASPR
jgi:Glycosyltransferase family 87